MNRLFKTAMTLAAVLMFATMAFQASAQGPQGPAAANEWRDRIRAEKIAFFTVEIGLSPSEAQVFWPVYNQVENEQMELVHKVGEAYFALEKAINGKAPESEIEAKLQAYNKAIEQRSQHECSQMSRYAKVLSREKIARLYVAEEKFRRQQIHKLHAPGTPPQGQHQNGQAHK